MTIKLASIDETPVCIFFVFFDRAAIIISHNDFPKSHIDEFDIHKILRDQRGADRHSSICEMLLPGGVSA